MDRLPMVIALPGRSGPHLDSGEQRMADTLIGHTHDIDRHGEDMAEIRGWMWAPQP